MSLYNWDKIVESAFWTVVAAALCAVVTVVAVGIVNAALSNGRIDFCYVEPVVEKTWFTTIETYRLKGHVPWRPDRTIVEHAMAFDEARAVADSIGCEIR